MDFSSIISGVGDFVDNNSSWLKPVAQVGLDLYKQYQQGGARDDVADLYREREKRNWEQYLAEEQAYQAQQAQSWAQAQANRRAAAAAAAATDANRREALGKANKVEQKNYKQMIKLIKPYQKATSALIDPSQKTFEQGFDTISMLNGILKGKDNMALLKDSGPAYGIDIPIPEYMKAKK